MSIKLKKILSEGTLSPEQKTTFLEAMKKFNEYGEQIYREHDLQGLAETMSQLSTGAGNFILDETEDWFDSVTVKRDVKEISKSSALFEKTAIEVAGLQSRLESLYEDLGNKLGRYYDLSEAVDHIDDKEAATDYDNLKDKDVDNDGDTDDSDEYLHKKLGTVAKKTEGISPKVGGATGQRWGIVTGKNTTGKIWRNW
jgi:hypothetical protein